MPEVTERKDDLCPLCRKGIPLIRTAHGWTRTHKRDGMLIQCTRSASYFNDDEGDDDEGERFINLYFNTEEDEEQRIRYA